MAGSAAHGTDAVRLQYDGVARILLVEFPGGRLYEYGEVPASVAQWLERIPHKLSFIRRMLDGQYRHRALAPRGTTGEADLEAALRDSLAALGRHG